MIVLDKKDYTIYISENKDATARELWGFVYARQIHGDSVCVVDKELKDIPSEHDAIVSKIWKMKIWVLLADCNGIVLMWKTRYGVVHAWRKWLQNGIITKVLHILEDCDEDISSLKVYIGPSIRECCYEVGEEFLWYFDTKYFTRRDGKLYFDMIKKLIDVLCEKGVLRENIEINEYCTCCSWKFFSYRKGNDNQRFIVAVEKK